MEKGRNWGYFIKIMSLIYFFNNMSQLAKQATQIGWFLPISSPVFLTPVNHLVGDIEGCVTSDMIMQSAVDCIH